MSEETQETQDIARGDEEMNRLRGQLRQQIAENETVQRQHRKDIETIGDALIAEADNRGWCEAYDEFVKGVNRNLTVDLKERIKEYDVEVRVSTTFFIRVEATTEDGARESVTSPVVRDELAGHAQNLDSDDWDVSDVTEVG